jgi:AcrR family transcriptional regulator
MGRQRLKDIEERILQQVTHEAATEGLGFVSTKRIAESLKISEPVIFSHFQTKENLLLKAYQRAFALYEDAFLPSIIAPEKSTAEERERKREEAINSLLDNHREEMVFIGQYQACQGLHLPANVRETPKEIREALMKAFQKMGKVSEEDLALLSDFYLMNSFFCLSSLARLPRLDDPSSRAFIDKIVFFGLYKSLKKEGNH